MMKLSAFCFVKFSTNFPPFFSFYNLTRVEFSENVTELLFSNYTANFFNDSAKYENVKEGKEIFALFSCHTAQNRVPSEREGRKKVFFCSHIV